MTEFKPDEIMLQNYIQNKLSPSDTEQLELWLVDNPEVMQDLEMDIMFKQADFNPNQQQNEVAKTSFSFLDFFTSKKLIPVHFLAYGMVALFVFNSLTSTQNTPFYSAATFIELEKVRGAEVSTINISHHVQNGIAIRFFPDSNKDNYKVVLQSAQSKKQIVFDNLIADDFDSITVMLDANSSLTNKWNVNIYNNENILEQNYIIKFN